MKANKGEKEKKMKKKAEETSLKIRTKMRYERLNISHTFTKCLGYFGSVSA